MTKSRSFLHLYLELFKEAFLLTSTNRRNCFLHQNTLCVLHRVKAPTLSSLHTEAARLKSQMLDMNQERKGEKIGIKDGKTDIQTVSACNSDIIVVFSFMAL